MAVILFVLDLLLASSIRVQRATREVRLGVFDLFTRCIRVTRFGALFLGLTILIGIAAFNSGTNLLYLMFGMLLAMVMVSGVSASVALSQLRFSRLLPDEIYAGDEFVVRLSVHNAKRVFPAMGLLIRESPENLGSDSRARAFVMKIGPRSSGTVRYLAQVDRRGIFIFDRLAVSTRFPFGIVEILFDIPLRDEVIVLPRMGQLRDTLILEGERRDEDVAKRSFLRGIETTFKGLRDFRRGDNPRHIHWRSSAKHRKLLVKEFDRREERNVCIFLDTYVADRELDGETSPLVERAVSFTATVLAELARQGYEVYLATCAPELFVGVGGGESRRLVELLKVLATLEPSREKDFADLFEDSRFHVPPAANVILVRVCDLMRARPSRPRVPGNGEFRVFVAEDEGFDRIFTMAPRGRRHAVGELEPSVVVA